VPTNWSAWALSTKRTCPAHSPRPRSGFGVCFTAHAVRAGRYPGAHLADLLIRRQAQLFALGVADGGGFGGAKRLDLVIGVAAAQLGVGGDGQQRVCSVACSHWCRSAMVWVKVCSWAK
jgi:hypothetical protein